SPHESYYATRTWLCFVAACVGPLVFIFFFDNEPATTEIYTLSLHDALPISPSSSTPPRCRSAEAWTSCGAPRAGGGAASARPSRSEEHTSELQSRENLVCRLLLEKKKKSI